MKDLNLLHPVVKSKADKLVLLAKERLGLRIIITMTLRTELEQQALYAKGRLTLPEVNKKLALAGMGPITAKENKIVTKARTVADSFHGYGLAFDIAVVSPDGKQINWTSKSDWNNDGKNDWSQVGSLAAEVGLEWGGNWTSMPDPPHYQDTLGWTIGKLKTNKITPGVTIKT